MRRFLKGMGSAPTRATAIPTIRAISELSRAVRWLSAKAIGAILFQVVRSVVAPQGQRASVFLYR